MPDPVDPQPDILRFVSLSSAHLTLQDSLLLTKLAAENLGVPAVTGESEASFNDADCPVYVVSVEYGWIVRLLSLPINTDTHQRVRSTSWLLAAGFSAAFVNLVYYMGQNKVDIWFDCDADSYDHLFPTYHW